MLGKVCTVCLLVTVSACLMRSQPASEEKIAGIADDVAALLSKIGAKSTDEAVSKMWAKGDDLTKADYEDLGKLLQSSDGAAALAAIQRPVTAKLARVSSILDEYNRGVRVPEEIRKGMLADLDKTIDDVGTAAGKLHKIRLEVLSSTNYHIPHIEYPARKILEMDKIEGIGLTRIRKLELVGTNEEVVQAYLLMRDFESIARFIRHTKHGLYRKGRFLALKKTMTEGSLEDEVLPIFRELFSTSGTKESYTEIVSSKVAGLKTMHLPIIRGNLASTKRALTSLRDAMLDRAKLFDETGISAARRKEIEIGTLRFLKGGGKDGSETLEKLGTIGWARITHDKFIRETATITRAVLSFDDRGRIVEIPKMLKEIENM